jgi:hypothetical protein
MLTAMSYSSVVLAKIQLNTTPGSEPLMKRRSFLKATAALLPAAGLQNFVLAQA